MHIRPFIPFGSNNELTFEDINSLSEVKKQREGKFGRFIMEKLSRTWLLNDPMDCSWFDNSEVYGYLKNQLIDRLSSVSLRHNNCRKYNLFMIFEYEILPDS